MFNKKFKVLATIMSLVFMFSLAAPPPAHAGWLDSVTSTVKGAYEAAKSTVTKTVDTVKTVVGTTIDTAKDVAANVKEVVTNTAKKVYETAKTAVKSVVTAVTGAGKKVADTAKAGADAVKDGAGKAADLAKDLGDDVSNELTAAIDNVKDFIAGKKEDFKDFQKMLVEFKDQGIDIIKMAAEEGEEKLVHPALAKIQEQAEKAKEGAKKIATDFGAALKGAAKGFDLAADKLGPIIDKGKNSFQIASALGEFKSPGGAASLDTSFSMGGVSWDTKNNIKGRAEGDISSAELLGSVDAHIGPRFKAEGNAEFFNGALAMTGSTDTVVGGWARGDGNLKFMKDGALLDAQASANVGVGVKSVNEGEITTQVGGGYGTRTSGSLEAMAGAEAGAEGTAYLGKNGIELSGKAEARCGAWVDGSASHAIQYKGNDLIGVGVGGGVGAGLGAGVEGGFAFQANKVGFQDVGFTLGPIKVNGTFYVNPVGMAEMAIDKGREAIDKGREVVDKGKELLGKIGDKLTFWD